MGSRSEFCTFARRTNAEMALRMNHTIKTRIHSLLSALNEGIYEKENEMALALLAALAGESILLLGPPGVAKSMVARQMKSAFEDARSFEYLMSRFSTPDEIFGPVSIARLKENDKYERTTEGFLPTADVVFLDEIWKAGPAIQNTLLTVMNEKLFRNGDREMRLPLKLFVAASNELPAKGEGLEALWDRFIFRVVCQCIENEDTFRKMLCEDSDPASSPTDIPKITRTEYKTWQEEAQHLPLSQSLLEAITHIRTELQHVRLDKTEIPRSVYISDRRWKHISSLLRMSAYSQGRPEASVADLLPMHNCLWNEPEEIPAIRQITLQAIFHPIEQRLSHEIQQVKADLSAHRAQKSLNLAHHANDHRDDDLLIADRFFYQVENHGTGHTFVFITDFKRMPARSRLQPPAQGIIYPDPDSPERSIVRLYSPILKMNAAGKNAERVTLCRDDEHIYINGVAFKMRRKGKAVLSPADGKIGMTGSGNTRQASGNGKDGTGYEERIDQICNELDALKKDLDGNLYVQHKDLNEVEAYLQDLYKQVALCRVDIRQLLYDEE